MKELERCSPITSRRSDIRLKHQASTLEVRDCVLWARPHAYPHVRTVVFLAAVTLYLAVSAQETQRELSIR